MKHPSSSATRRNDVARKAASGTAEVRLTLLLRSPEGVGYPTPAVIPAKAGITKHPSSSATRRNGVPMKAASGTAEVRLTLLPRSPEGVGYPTPAVIPAKAGITKHPSSSPTRRNDVARKAATGTAEVRLTLLLRSLEGDRDSCLRRNDEVGGYDILKLRAGFSPPRRPSGRRSFRRPGRCPQAGLRVPRRAGLRLT